MSIIPFLFFFPLISTLSFKDSIPIETINLQNTLTPNLKSIFDTNECLPDNTLAKRILNKDYGITLNKIDDNLKFIIGKCNPVIFVPGIYASKLVLTINCGGFKKENKDKYMEMRVFCGDAICQSDSIEEHPLFVSLLDPATAVLNTETNKYSACLGFFMQFYNKKDECPIDDNGNHICYYSKYIEIGPYGSSSNTVKDNKCGLNGVTNVIQTGNEVLDSVVNQGAPKVFITMIKRLKQMGYRDGFSYAGIPYDYRRSLNKNDFAINTFKYHVNTLFKNTGKKVVIVAHSYGTLLTLNNLIGKNKNLANKIKKFIAIGPPFAGSSKLLDIFLHGMTAWDVNFDLKGEKISVINYNPYGQNIMYKALPTIMELRPLSIISDLFKKSEYKDFADAIKERLDLEKYCKNNLSKCTKNLINERNKKFKNIFGDSFPDLSNDDCKNTDLKRGKNEMFKSVCMTEMFNPECPMVLMKDNNFKPKIPDSNYMDQICGIKNNSLYYVQSECKKEKCVDDIYINEFIYPFENKEKTQFFIDRFNKEYSNEFGKKISMDYFEKKSSFTLKYKKLIEEHTKTSITKDLPIPPVDTDIIYTTFNPTKSVFVYNKQNTNNFDDSLGYGGDDTVPNWSSLLTGFKWLYDKKKYGLKQEIRLIEFCSKLGKKSQFKYDPKNSKVFSALSCDCLNKNNNYVDNVKPCSHSAMISDSFLINYVETIINDRNEKINPSQDKMNAVKKFNPNENFVLHCNSNMRKIFLEDKN